MKKCFIVLSVILFGSISLFASSVKYMDDLQYVDKKYHTLLDISNAELVKVLNYPGGSIPPANMHFYSNGLLVIDSCIFGKNFPENEKKYYKWESAGYRHSTKESKLKIYFIDNRIDFDKVSPEFDGYDILKVDEVNKAIVLKVPRDGSVLFFNFVFFKNSY